MANTEFDLPQVIDNSKGDHPAAVAAEALHFAAYQGVRAGAKAISQIENEKQFYDNVSEGLASGIGSAAKCVGDFVGKDYKVSDLNNWCKTRINFDWLTPTKEEVTEAKKKIDSHVSELIPERDQKLLKDMQHALLDGNLDQFERDIKSFRGDPARLKAFVKELNTNLKETHADVSLAVSGDGNVLIYKNQGSAAVEISPWTGTRGVRPIRNTWDGTVILEPGEVLGKAPQDVMKEVGNHAVNRMTAEPLTSFDPLPIRPFKPRWDEDDGVRPTPWIRIKPHHDSLLFGEKPNRQPYLLDNVYKNSAQPDITAY